jgi:RimJ/RimL family protein N-acetyltransferase
MKNQLIAKPATIEDAELLFIWRNDIETRMNSANTKKIKFEDHLVWLDKTINDINKFLFIFYILDQSGDNYIPVGTTRMDYDVAQNIYELSWMVAPKKRGKSIGKTIVSRTVDFLFGKNIKARIKFGNNASCKIAEYVGMKYIHAGFIKGEEDILYYYRKGED